MNGKYNKTISISPKTLEELRALAAAREVSMRRMVELLVAQASGTRPGRMYKRPGSGIKSTIKVPSHTADLLMARAVANGRTQAEEADKVIGAILDMETVHGG